MYSWKPGSVHKIKAQIAGQVLEAMIGQHGQITPSLVVDESRPATAPLHGEFEWDDSIAAEKYREDQARYIIRSIVINTSDDSDKQPMRFLVQVIDSESESVFIRTSDALADPALRRQVLGRFLKEMQTLERRYSEYEELALIFESAKIVRRQLVAAAS